LVLEDLSLVTEIVYRHAIMARNLFVFGMPLLVLGLLFSRAEAEEPPSERGASGVEAELLRLEKV